jgi:hypothetical protein
MIAAVIITMSPAIFWFLVWLVVSILLFAILPTEEMEILAPVMISFALLVIYLIYLVIHVCQNWNNIHSPIQFT